MRVLFTVFSATAHVHPIVPLAWALRSAGHEVLVAVPATATDPGVLASITAAGLTAVPVGGAPEGTPEADLERIRQASREGLVAFADVWRFDPHEPAELVEFRTDPAFNKDVVPITGFDALAEARVTQLRREYLLGRCDKQLAIPSVNAVTR